MALLCSSSLSTPGLLDPTSVSWLLTTFHEFQLCICFTLPGACLANLRVEIRLLKPLRLQNVCVLTLAIRELFIAFSKLILAVIYYTTFNVFVYTVRCYTAFNIFMQSHALLRSIDSCSHMLHCTQRTYAVTCHAN